MNKFNSIVTDSRKATPGSTFFCIKGVATDGHDYAKSAYENGARDFYSEKPLDLPDDAVVHICEDTRKELSSAYKEFYNHPEEKLKIIGVTGTKGKTSVANIIYNLLNSCGKKAGLIGTTGIYFDDIYRPSLNTTPDLDVLYPTFAEFLEYGVEYCVMEVSSQAYKIGRVEGIKFDTAIYTNLSPDHIGPNEHPSFDDYMFCKAMLFENSDFSIINIDDDFSDVMIDHSKGDVVTYSVKKDDADYVGRNIESWKTDSSLGVEFDYCAGDEETHIQLCTPGKFSVYNALAAISACRHYGIPLSEITKKVRYITAKGRFEIVDALPYATFIIDFAHNGVSLENVLSTIKEYEPKNLICLVGSVGDRTQIRRTEIGNAVAKYCDFAILTADNPGHEKVMNIIIDIERAIDDKIPCFEFEDREEAIIYAVKTAKPGDVVLFAGKGHEDYQLIGDEHVPFNEREIILKAAKELTMK